MKRTIFAVTLCVALVLGLTNNVLADRKSRPGRQPVIK